MDKKDILKKSIIVTAIVVLIDQISKILISIFLKNDSMDIIPDVLSFTHVTNEGMAFSLNTGNIKNIVLSVFVLILIINYLRTQYKYINKFNLMCLDFILAGGIANLIDRIFRGAVVDFIDIKDFPIFNIADMFVVIGWVLFIVYMFRFEVKNNVIRSEKNAK